MALRGFYGVERAGLREKGDPNCTSALTARSRGSSLKQGLVDDSLPARETIPVARRGRSRFFGLEHVVRNDRRAGVRAGRSLFTDGGFSFRDGIAPGYRNS